MSFLLVNSNTIISAIFALLCASKKNKNVQIGCVFTAKKKYFCCFKEMSRCRHSSRFSKIHTAFSGRREEKRDHGVLWPASGQGLLRV